MNLKTKITNRITLVTLFCFVLPASLIFLIFGFVYNNLLSDIYKNLQADLLKLLTFIGAVFLVGGFVVSRLLAKRIVNPLEKIIKTINAASKGKLDARVNVKGGDMDELVAAVNNMIDETVKMKQVFDEQIKRTKELDKTKSEFISIAAHQLRTPLSAIKWTFKMMIDGDIGDVTLEQKEFLKRGYITNERMITLVNDLLNVSRIEEGRFGYEFKAASAEDIVENLLKAAQPLLEEKSIRFTFNKPNAALRKISTDEEKLALAIENILNNAIKYTPPQGKITFSLEDKDNMLTIAISDTGVGIPKDQLSRLFSKFFRGSNAIRLQTDGSGLGLFITKNIIEKHKGSITVESEESKGTTVKIILPFIEPKILSSE